MLGLKRLNGAPKSTERLLTFVKSDCHKKGSFAHTMMIGNHQPMVETRKISHRDTSVYTKMHMPYLLKGFMVLYHHSLYHANICA